MKKIASVLLIVLLGLSLSGCFKKTEKEVVKTNKSDLPSFTGNMDDIIKKGSPAKCVYELNQNNAKLKGTIYVSGKKLRTDVHIVDPEEREITTHFISDGNYGYSWGSNMKNGIKSKIEIDETDMGAPETDNEDFSEYKGNYKDVIDYKCEEWKEEKDNFTPPGEIIFQDLDELTAKLTEGFNNPDTMNKTACDLCDNAPTEESVADCKKNIPDCS